MAVKILVIKTSALGDIVHLYPTIQFLKELHPEAEIDWVVEAQGASLVQNNPLVHRTLILNTKKWRKSIFQNFSGIKAFIKQLREVSYDYIFDFQGNTKSGIVLGLAKGKEKIGFGPTTVPEKPNLLFTTKKFDPPPGRNIREDYLSFVEQSFQKNCTQIKNTFLKISSEEEADLQKLTQDLQSHNIMVCPGSMWPNKKLPLTTWFEFLKGFEKSQFYFVYGSPQEEQEVQELQQKLGRGKIVPKLSLPLLQRFMGKMELVLAVDSLPLHLAAEAGVYTFSVFGPSSLQKYQPLTSHKALQGPCPYGVDFSYKKRCPKLRTCPTGACMKKISAESLFNLSH